MAAVAGGGLEQARIDVSLVDTAQGPRLRVGGEAARGFHGMEVEPEVWLCPLDGDNAAAARRLLPWTAPVPVGLRQSIGVSDRLGLAAAGLLRVARRGDLFPVLAQQSIQEMAESGRAPQEIIDAATWGALAAGYRDGYGSEADGLQTTAMIDLCVEAGFAGFTLEPGSCLPDPAALEETGKTLDERFAALPWERLALGPAELLAAYAGASPAGPLMDETVMRLACVYGAALAEIACLAGHLARRMGERPYDLGVRLGRGNALLGPVEHYFVAAELRRLGVRFTALALDRPEQDGRLAGGAGDRGGLEAACAMHAAIMRGLGPYRLALTAGPDGSSMYSILARYASPYIHRRITGVDWLAALQVLAGYQPALLRAMLAHALQAYPDGGAAQVRRVPVTLPDDRLPELLAQPDAREILLEMGGPLLKRFRSRILTALGEHRAAYDEALEAALVWCVDA